MFMVMESNVFSAIGGFDERFFLYCEDYDLCARLYRSGYSLMLDQSTHVVHDAQRASYRSMRHLTWHLGSLLRVWFSRLFWEVTLLSRRARRGSTGGRSSMTTHDEYFEYLKGRSRLGNVYRKYLLYPALCRRLEGRTLDVGCGIGDMLVHRGNTVGVDVNPRTVEFCKVAGGAGSSDGGRHVAVCVRRIRHRADGQRT